MYATKRPAAVKYYGNVEMVVSGPPGKHSEIVVRLVGNCSSTVRITSSTYQRANRGFPLSKELVVFST